MALFTDGPISAAKDLQEYESSVLSDAQAEGINVAAKVALAQQELGSELIVFLVRRARFRDDYPNVRNARGTTDVVVTDTLRQWHIHKTLAMVYRDAYNNQLNDRYKGKWTQYEQLEEASARMCFQLGVGVVADPVVKAPTPALASIPGSGPAGTYYVAASWVNVAGQEGVPSDTTKLSNSAGQVLTVALAAPPQNAVGWNVYVGVSPTALAIQNDTPLRIDSSWVMSGGLIPGAVPTMGQTPDWFIVDHHVIERG